MYLRRTRVPHESPQFSFCSGPPPDRFESMGCTLLNDISAGRTAERRDAVTLAHSVLESDVIRAAEAVLNADDATLLARVVELLSICLATSE
jgi:hypothetical protein